MSTQFEPKEVLSKNKAQYDSLACRLAQLCSLSVQDGAVHAQIQFTEAAMIRIDWDWAAQKEP